jgi:hypothetical protein
MPVPSTIADLSTVAGSNSPAGTDNPSQGDDYLRAQASFIAQLRDLTNGTSGTLTGLALNVTGISTFTGAVTASSYIDTPNTAAFCAYRTTSQSLTASTVNTCIFPAEEVDRSSSYDISTGIFTAPRTGMYLFCVRLYMVNASVSATTYGVAYITRNNSSTSANLTYLDAPLVNGENINGSSNAFSVGGSHVCLMTAGDTMRVIYTSNSGGALSLLDKSKFSGTYLG